MTGLIDIDFGGDRHACHWPRILSGGNPGIERAGVVERLVGEVLYHRVQRRIDHIQPVEMGLRHLDRRHGFAAHHLCQFDRLFAPKLCHVMSFPCFGPD